MRRGARPSRLVGGCRRKRYMKTWTLSNNSILLTSLSEIAEKKQAVIFTLNSSFAKKRFICNDGMITSWHNSNKQRQVGALGLALVEMDIISYEELARAFAQQRQYQKHYCEILRENGILDVEEIQLAASCVVADEIGEAFTWEEGIFEVTKERTSQTGTTRNRLHSAFGPATTRKLAHPYMHNYAVPVPFREVLEKIPGYLEEWYHVIQDLGTLKTVLTVNEMLKKEYEAYLNTQLSFCPPELWENSSESRIFEISIGQLIKNDMALINGRNTLQEILATISYDSLSFGKILNESIHLNYIRHLTLEELSALADKTKELQNLKDAKKYYQCVLEHEELSEARKEEIKEIISSLNIISSINVQPGLQEEGADSLMDVTFPGYEIEEEIGKGGMGKIYKARQESLNRFVAIKLISPKYSSDPIFIKRLDIEAKTMARLKHPNIISAIDFGFQNRCYYIIMEYVEGGRSLLRYIEEKGTIEEKEVLKIGLCIAKAIECLEENHLIHRDVKPSNILLDSDGTPKLADLGLIKDFEVEADITQPGTALGSPAYMSPEQIQCKEIDIRTDIYSLGATMLHALVGNANFSALGLVSYQCSSQAQINFRGIGNFSDAIAGLLAKMLQGKPEDRYQNPKELIEDIERIFAGKPTRYTLSQQVFQSPRKSKRNAVCIVALLIIGGIVGWLYLQLNPGKKAESTPLANSVFTVQEELKQGEEVELIRKGEQNQKVGEEALSVGDFKNACDFFSLAFEHYAEAQQKAPSQNIFAVKEKEIGESWLAAVSRLKSGEDLAVHEQTLQCYEYGLKLKELPPDVIYALERLQDTTRQKIDSIHEKRRSDMLRQGDEYREKGQSALDRADFEAACGMFTKAGESCSILEQQYPSVKISSEMNSKIGEAWLTRVQSLRKDGNLKDALQCCRHGSRFANIPLHIRDELVLAEHEIAEAVKTQEKFTMSLKEAWLSTSSSEKGAGKSEVFDVADKIYVHVVLILSNHDPKQQLTCSGSGKNITEIKSPITGAPNRGECHWSTRLKTKKKSSGKHRLMLKIQCQDVSLEKEFSFSLKYLADDLVYAGKNDKGYEEYLRTRDKMVMILIPSGEFMMGDPTDEGYVDETRHTVVLDAYLIDKYEVSNRQYALFLNWWQEALKQEKARYDCQLSPELMKKFGDDGTHIPKYWDNPKYNNADTPVVGVDWFDAYAYARWANNLPRTDQSSCLPTEAQWEKAAAWDETVSKSHVYPWGDKIDLEHANFFDSKKNSASPVTDYLQGISPYGLYNMGGNAAEWCEDWYGRDYYRLAPRVNPENRKAVAGKVFRNGGFNSKGWELRSSRRRNCEPHLSSVEIGFRCARWLPEQK